MTALFNAKILFVSYNETFDWHLNRTKTKFNLETLNKFITFFFLTKKNLVITH